MQHVLRLLEQLLVVDGLDAPALFAAGRSPLERSRISAPAAGDPCVTVGVGVLREPLDGVQQRPHPGLRHPGPRSADPAGDLERADAVRGEPVDLDVVLDAAAPASRRCTQLRHRSRAFPTGSGAASSSYPAARSSVEGLVDLRVGVGDRDRGRSRGEHHRQHGHDERRVASVEQVEHRILERQ